ncbi:MAG: VOC family protein [Patescibacteria group bacterium]|jgi:catechol 2,3-dioxygenase-like lactoylglutathione lyase family enzyme
MYHLAIPAVHIEQSCNFYEKLGFRKVDKWEKPEQNLVGVWMEDDTGSRIELVLHPNNKTILFPEIVEVHHFGVKVKNLENTLQELKKDKIKIIIPPTKGMSVKQFAVIKDPAGFPVELFEQ